MKKKYYEGNLYYIWKNVLPNTCHSEHLSVCPNTCHSEHRPQMSVQTFLNISQVIKVELAFTTYPKDEQRPA